MALTPNRRTFLKQFLFGSGIVLGSRTKFEEQWDLSNSPRSRLIFEEDVHGVMKRVDDGERVVVETVFDAETTTYDYLVQQVWDYETNTVTDVHYESLRGGDTVFENVAGENEISVTYAHDRSGSWQYLFDLSVPSTVQSRLIDAIEKSGTASESDTFERSFEADGIRIAWQDGRDDGSAMTITIPYSLYAKRRNEGSNGAFDVLPRVSDSDFSRDVHQALIDALRTEIEYFDGQSDEQSSTYRNVDVISEYVQSIPHALDRESKGQWNYIRTPEECLAELTADCKDASLLLYHLLQHFGYDPKFVFLLGSAFESIEDVSETIRRDREKDDRNVSKAVESDDLYTNHLAVALPKSDLGPVPEDLRDDTVAIEHEGKPYLYIESTSVNAPGIVPDAHSDKPKFVY